MRRQYPLLGSLLLLSTLLLSGPLGCEETVTSPKSATAGTSETTSTGFNIQTTMDELAVVLTKRSELLQTLLRNPQAFTRTQADLVSQTFYEENRLIGLIDTQVKADPASLPLVCSAYDATARAAVHQQAKDYQAVRESPQCGPALAAKVYKNDYSQRARSDGIGIMYLMMNRGVRAYIEKFPESRGKFDLETLCLKQRLIEPFNPAK